MDGDVVNIRECILILLTDEEIEAINSHPRGSNIHLDDYRNWVFSVESGGEGAGAWCVLRARDAVLGGDRASRFFESKRWPGIIAMLLQASGKGISTAEPGLYLYQKSIC